MQVIDWSASARTVGAKNVPTPVARPPVVTRPTRHGVVDVPCDDVALGGRGHGADVVVVAAVLLSLSQLTDLRRQRGDELVVHRRLDVDPFDGCITNGKFHGVITATSGNGR
jgi:hypothetical protein